MTESTRRDTTRPGSSATTSANAGLARLVGAVLAGVLVGFLAAFAWQYPRAERLERSASYATRALEAARLESTLSAAVIEAQGARYEIGRQRASGFFTGLQRRLVPVLAGDAQTAARALLAQRDPTVTTLARNDPASASVLAETLGRYREVVRLAGLDSAVAASPAP